ncbi:MAG: nitroreductase family protein [Candidatus Thorarchaeota archaeon]
MTKEYGGLQVDILSLIKKRRHIHHFESNPVSESTIRSLLEAVRWAPSAGNLQPWEIVVIRSDSQKAKLVEAAGGKQYMRTAPVILVFCADLNRTAKRYGERGTALYVIQDTAAAIQNVLLAAKGLGLGSGWVGAFNEDSMAEVLGLPSNVRPLAIILIGKPAENPVPPTRREIQEFLHLEQYGSKGELSD